MLFHLPSLPSPKAGFDWIIVILCGILNIMPPHLRAGRRKNSMQALIRLCVVQLPNFRYLPFLCSFSHICNSWPTNRFPETQVQTLAGLPHLFVLPKYINAKLCSQWGRESHSNETFKTKTLSGPYQVTAILAKGIKFCQRALGIISSAWIKHRWLGVYLISTGH